MGVLQRFERRLEGMVGLAFARLFKGKVHPAEIAKALQREATERKSVVGEGRVLVPNRYVVRLGPTDYEYLSEWEAELSSTMAEMVQEHIDDEGWSTFGSVLVNLERDDDLHTGVFHVDSRVDADPVNSANAGAARVDGAPFPQGRAWGPGGELYDLPADGAAGSDARAAPAAGSATKPPPRVPGGGLPPVPGVAGAGAGAGGKSTPPRSAPPVSHALVVDGPNTRHELREGSNLIGRGVEASIRLPDTGVSRLHVDVQLSRGAATVVDLGSTNGTIVNGRRVPQIVLSDGDVIRIGHSVLVYRQDSRPARVPS